MGFRVHVPKIGFREVGTSYRSTCLGEVYSLFSKITVPFGVPVILIVFWVYAEVPLFRGTTT